MGWLKYIQMMDGLIGIIFYLNRPALYLWLELVVLERHTAYLINDDTGRDIKPFPSGGIISFKEIDKNGSLVAVGVALSVVANIRGIDFSDYDYIVFDEFIASAG